MRPPVGEDNESGRGFMLPASAPRLNEDSLKTWKCFVNSKYDRNTGKWEMKKVRYVRLIK